MIIEQYTITILKVLRRERLSLMNTVVEFFVTIVNAFYLLNIVTKSSS